MRLSYTLSIILLLTPLLSLTALAQDRVVLYHGITRDSEFVQPLADFLAEQGFEVLNLSYPSTTYTLEALAEQQIQQLPKLLGAKQGKVHFVGHSMGGMLIVRILNKWRPAELGRVVTLGSPFQGSELSDLLKNTSYYKKEFGITGQELTTDYPTPKFNIDYELGSIAGTLSFPKSWLYWLIFRQPNDSRTSVESSQLAGMKSHIVLKVGHNQMLTDETTQAQLLGFLKHGAFPLEQSK